jgi:hypothetical protein
MPASGGRVRSPLFPFAVLCLRRLHAQVPRNQAPYFLSSRGRQRAIAEGLCEPRGLQGRTEQRTGQTTTLPRDRQPLSVVRGSVLSMAAGVGVAVHNDGETTLTPMRTWGQVRGVPPVRRRRSRRLCARLPGRYWAWSQSYPLNRELFSPEAFLLLQQVFHRKRENVFL